MVVLNDVYQTTIIEVPTALPKGVTLNPNHLPTVTDAFDSNLISAETQAEVFEAHEIRQRIQTELAGDRPAFSALLTAADPMAPGPDRTSATSTTTSCSLMPLEMFRELSFITAKESVRSCFVAVNLKLSSAEMFLWARGAMASGDKRREDACTVVVVPPAFGNTVSTTSEVVNDFCRSYGVESVIHPDDLLGHVLNHLDYLFIEAPSFAHDSDDNELRNLPKDLLSSINLLKKLRKGGRFVLMVRTVHKQCTAQLLLLLGSMFRRAVLFHSSADAQLHSRFVGIGFRGTASDAYMAASDAYITASDAYTMASYRRTVMTADIPSSRAAFRRFYAEVTRFNAAVLRKYNHSHGFALLSKPVENLSQRWYAAHLEKEEGYRYAVDWFSEHVPAWNAILAPRFVGKPAVQALFLGPYEGRCIAWLFKHVLIGPGCRATIIEDFQELAHCVGFHGVPVWNPDVEGSLLHNLGMEGIPYELLRTGPAEGLLQLRSRQPAPAYDVVYIDARSSRHVLEAAVMAFPLLAPGGVMVITNNTHGKTHDAACPRRGIDGFLDAYVTEIKVLRHAFHLFLERRATPFTLPSCASEYFDPEPALPPCRIP